MDHIIRQRLHELYDWLQICKEMCELYGYDVNEIAKDEIIKKKRKIRDIYKQENEKPERHIVHDNGIDGYIELLQLPEEITTRETADECFNIINIWNMFLLHLIAQDRDLRVGTSLLKETEDGGLTIAFRLMCERREI